MTIAKLNRDFYPVVNRFFKNDLDWYGGSMQNEKCRKPAVNILENNDGFEIEMAAPGIQKEDFKINFENGMLSISAEAKKQDENENYRLKEFGYDGFKRNFKVDEKLVNTDDIQAKYENGILKLSIPKREEVKPKPARNIEIS